MLSDSHTDLCLKVLDLHFLSWFFLCSALCFSCWTVDISQTASYEITLAERSVCLYVFPSVRLSLNILMIGSLVFSDIVHDDSWQWRLVTDGARFLKKKLAAQIWAKWTKIRPKTAISFIIFREFSMFYQFFLLPLVKRWTIITNKHGIYALPHELRNYWKLRISGDQGISVKYVNFIEW